MLKFDSANHLYYLDGKIIPGYSEIAQAEGLVNYSNVPEYILNAAQYFGSAVHLMCELWDRNNLDLETLDENLLPFLEGYKTFLKDYKVEVIPSWIENPSYSEKWLYATTPDRLAKIGKDYVVYEIKTTNKMQPSVELQTAAHKIVIEEQERIRVAKRYGIKLLPNKYEVFEYNKARDEKVWLSAVTLFHYKKEKNGKSK